MAFSVDSANLFINAPFQDLASGGLLDFFVRRRLQPEISLEGEHLYNKKPAEFAKVADSLRAHGLGCTLHAPFLDLAPGALDSAIREASRYKLDLAFELIPIFRPRVIVCHLNFEENKHASKESAWRKHALSTWQRLLTVARSHNTTMVLENTYETSPAQHLYILRTLNSPHARFCLDTGHLAAFAKSSWEPWTGVIDSYLSHIHLHDNLGDRDAHLAVGRGIFDFQGLFEHLQKRHKPTVTLEPHSRDDLDECLHALREMRVIT